jgi:RimJ/RimL family protein N-acetyltransferase
MSAAVRAQLSAQWCAQLDDPAVDSWTLGFAVVNRASGASVGTCGFKGPPAGDGSVEIAYAIEPEHQRHGYATEAAVALVEYAFASGRVCIVRAHTESSSNASARVLTKCGFRLIGEVVDPDDGLVWRWERASGA